MFRVWHIYIQNEEQELVKQVALVLEEIHQIGDEKTVDAIVFNCDEILILKAREANIEIIEIEKFLHSESLKWLRFSNKMIFGK